MTLFLARHGQANHESIDPNKNLSEIGKKEAAKMAEFLGQLGITVGQIWHSDKARAKQTAEILASAVKLQNGITEKTGLRPNDPVGSIAVEIQAYNNDLMLVSHLPFMSKLASLLLAGDEDRCSIEFHPVSIACLERDKGKWSIKWLVEPGLLQKRSPSSFQSYH